MSLRKTAPLAAPHAVYTYADWSWAVLKVNAPAKGPDAPYTTWFCAVQSPFTGNSHDMGDTYAADVLQYGQLQSATDEFKAYLIGGAK